MKAPPYQHHLRFRNLLNIFLSELINFRRYRWKPTIFCRIVPRLTVQIRGACVA
ncbi:hypothetical protein KCP74_13465 [Salmonella enterica subsp. enterica]|nr:hypothetical protein KCP74_13465 [Salmonella enterica subsp. enterica]